MHSSRLSFATLTAFTTDQLEYEFAAPLDTKFAMHKSTFSTGVDIRSLLDGSFALLSDKHLGE